MRWGDQQQGDGRNWWKREKTGSERRMHIDVVVSKRYGNLDNWISHRLFACVPPPPPSSPFDPVAIAGSVYFLGAKHHMQIKLRMQPENFNWSETKWTEERKNEKKKNETPKPKPETSEVSAASQQHISAPFEYLFKIFFFRHSIEVSWPQRQATAHRSKPEMSSKCIAVRRN